jgi:hypothetical protein
LPLDPSGYSVIGKKSRRSKYAPSITSLFFGVKGKGGSIFTAGLDVRPLMGGTRKNKRRKKR